MEAKKNGGTYFRLVKEKNMNTHYSSVSSSFSYMAWSTNKSLKNGSEIASLAELQLFRRFFSERISLSSLVVRSCHMIFVKDDTHSNIELAIKGSLKYVDAYFQLTWGFDSDEVLST